MAWLLYRCSLTHCFVLPGVPPVPILLLAISSRLIAPPIYPFRAAQRGIEGFVELRFDVTASGVPHNIQVIHAEPQGVFEQAAQNAVARGRFQPRLVEGEPQPFFG